MHLQALDLGCPRASGLVEGVMQLAIDSITVTEVEFLDLPRKSSAYPRHTLWPQASLTFLNQSCAAFLAR